MTRISRAESQARTRQQLVEVASELFLRDGYFATSIERVAETAGFSKGAVYSNFRTKDELCLAVIDQIRADQVSRIAAALTSAAEPADRIAAFEAWADTTLGDEGWSSLELEFATQVRRNPELRAAYAERASAIRQLLAALLTTAADDLGLRLPLPADDAATGLLSLGVGLGLQRAVDPSLPVSALTDLVRLLAGITIA